jgi:hypothetical protein
VKLKTGSRYRSQADSTEVIVVRSVTDDVDLRCGGHPMVDLTAAADELQPSPGFDTGSLLGKRYTKPGAGTLSVAETPLAVKESKPLPSSD